MKKSIKKILVLTMLILVVLSSCNVDVDVNNPDDPNKGTDGKPVPEKYTGFYQYPNGRKDPSGLLQITNSVNSEVLVFMNDVLPANYIGTIGSLNSIKVKLPEQKFYTIIAVMKKDYEDDSDQAGRFSDLTYYSFTQPYSMSVNPSSLSGGGKWIIKNSTNYWVSFMKADKSGEIYAVVAPKALRVTVPVPLDTTIDFVPHFYKEIKYNGQVIALSEFDDVAQADSVYIRSSSATKQFNTDIGGDLQPPNKKIKPSIFVTNNSDKSVRVFSGINNQQAALSNGAQAGDDYVLTSGESQVFTGLEPGVNVNSINFSALAWANRVYVTENIELKINKVYRIVLNRDLTTSVTEEDGEKPDGTGFYDE